MERVDVGRLIEGIYGAEVEWARGRGRPKKRWAEEVKVERKGLSFQEGVRRERSRSEWEG